MAEQNILTASQEALGAISSGATILPVAGEGPPQTAGGVDERRILNLISLSGSLRAIVAELAALKDKWTGTSVTAGKTDTTIAALGNASGKAGNILGEGGDLPKALALGARAIVETLVDIRDNPPTHDSLAGITSDQHHAESHAASHVDGTDDVRDATVSLKGLATAAQITKLDGITAGADVTDAYDIISGTSGTPIAAVGKESLEVFGQDGIITETETGGGVGGIDQLEVKLNISTGAGGGLTADATPDGAADYVATWDNSASAHKKVLLKNLPVAWTAVTGKLIIVTKTFYAPDFMQDVFPVMYYPSVSFPYGVTVQHLSIRLPLDTNYSVVFTEFDVADSGDLIHIVSTTGGTERYKEVESGWSGNPDIAADSWIMAAIPPDDVDWLSVCVVVKVNDS